MRIASVDLQASGEAVGPLAAFYGERLGMPVRRSRDRVVVRAGPDELAFAPAPDGDPFHHFALLIPGNRFAAAHAWIGERATVLPGRDGSTVFPFAFWDAVACYFHDPAGNIVELIAHHGMEEAADDRPFGAEELLGISEIGVVVPDPAVAVERLERELGLSLWSGSAGGLAFVGRKAHTLIVASEGRGWLPTGRPSAAHPVDVAVTGGDGGELRLEGSRVRRVS